MRRGKLGSSGEVSAERGRDEYVDAVAVFYALRDRCFGQLIEFFPTQEVPERTLAEILADELEWHELLGVLPVEFEASAN